MAADAHRAVAVQNLLGGDEAMAASRRPERARAAPVGVTSCVAHPVEAGMQIIVVAIPILFCSIHYNSWLINEKPDDTSD